MGQKYIQSGSKNCKFKWVYFFLAMARLLYDALCPLTIETDQTRNRAYCVFARNNLC